MDETAVKRVLAPFCPPLGHSQVEAIASKIAELSTSELEATSKASASAAKVAARRRKRSSKSRSRK